MSFQVKRDDEWIDIDSLYEAFSGETVRKGPGYPAGTLNWEVVDCGKVYRGNTLSDALDAWDAEHPHIEVLRKRRWVPIASIRDMLPGEQIRNGSKRKYTAPHVNYETVGRFEAATMDEALAALEHR